MRVLVACEYSGVVRDAFLARGHDAVSCDLLPTESPGPHIQGDVLDVLEDNWDMMIAHPPCTYLSVSGMHWTRRGLRDPALTEEALQFVWRLMQAPIARIALENPLSVISSRIRKPDQIVQPYQFGHDASKKTCLWLQDLPALTPTQYVEPRWVAREGRDPLPRWANQTDSGQNRLPPSADRWKKRSAFWTGIAEAMATQWGRPTAPKPPAG